MERNIPRAAIHVGTDKKSFSSQVGNEAERRGWDEKRYQLKNADIDKNNHYNYSRKRLNFEIVKGGKIVFFSVFRFLCQFNKLCISVICFQFKY